MGRRRVGVVGFGAIAEMGHLPALAAPCAGVEVAAVAEVDPVRRAWAGDLLGADLYPCAADLCAAAPELDLTIVSVPPTDAPPVVRSLVGAGYRVLVEKPFAVSAVAAAAISDELAAGPDVRVVHNYLYRSDVSTAAEILRAGGVGDVRLIRLEQVEAGHFPGAGPDPDWRRRPTGIGGGCLADNSYHWLYVAEFLAGSPIVGAVGLVGAVDDDLAEDIASTTLRHRNGVVTTVLTGWCAVAARDVLEVHGTTGSMALLGQGSGVVLTDSRGARPVAPIDDRDSFARMYDGLGPGLDRGALPGATLEENHRLLQIIDHLYVTAGSAPVLPP